MILAFFSPPFETAFSPKIPLWQKCNNKPITNRESFTPAQKPWGGGETNIHTLAWPLGSYGSAGENAANSGTKANDRARWPAERKAPSFRSMCLSSWVQSLTKSLLPTPDTCWIQQRKEGKVRVRKGALFTRLSLWNGWKDTPSPWYQLYDNQLARRGGYWPLL